MHPIFGNSDPNQVPQVPPTNNNIMTPGMPLQNQYNQNYMTPQATVSPMNTGYYQPQAQQQHIQETPDHSNLINYSNFNNFAGGQTQSQPQQAQSPPPNVPVAQEVREKAPLPEEFIYLQTVFEELKTQCVNRATNPVRCDHSKFVNRKFQFNLLAANET
jgi:hypothetical protein